MIYVSKHLSVTMLIYFAISESWLASFWLGCHVRSSAMAHGSASWVVPAKSVAWMLDIVGYLLDGYDLHFINPEEESINKLHAMQICLLYF